MARRIPSISTLSGSSCEIIEHGKNGLLFEHQNSTELASVIEQLIGDQEFADRIGAAGYQTVKDRFSHEKFSAEILGFYKRVLG
jgi:glycosyltransferase involved in cell wall biosynthesis